MEKLQNTELSPLDRYVHSTSICNTLAFLVSQGTMTEFLQRISLLIRLKKCWSKGHSDIQLYCSSDDDFHDELCHLSPEEFTCDNNVLQPVSEAMKGNTCNSGGDADMVPEQCNGQSSMDGNNMNLSPDACHMENEATEIPFVIKFPRQRRCRTSGRRHTGGAGRRKKHKNMVKQHICAECGHVFSQRQLLVTHLVTHTGERPFPCRHPGCDKRFGQNSTRNYHECTHSDARPHVCSQCGLGFKLAMVLRMHVTRIHGSGETPHHCDQCGRQFKLIGGLQTHIRTVHSDDRPHACSACPKRFKSRQQLVRHTRDIHSTEKPLHCPVCNRTFTQSCNLRTHMRTHTGEKPFVCDICGVRFAHSGSLKGHRSSHHSQPLPVTKTECEISECS